jgi:hypothetical protein
VFDLLYRSPPLTAWPQSLKPVQSLHLIGDYMQTSNCGDDTQKTTTAKTDTNTNDNRTKSHRSVRLSQRKLIASIDDWRLCLVTIKSLQSVLNALPGILPRLLPLRQNTEAPDCITIFMRIELFARCQSCRKERIHNGYLSIEFTAPMDTWLSLRS